MQYDYTVHTDKTVTKAAEAVEKALADRKFSVLWQLNVNDTLKEKGFDLKPEFRILEVCSAPRAKEALETNINVGYFLPCKIVVFSDQGQTRIGLLRPRLLMEILGEPRLKALADEVEDALVAAIDAAR